MNNDVDREETATDATNPSAARRVSFLGLGHMGLPMARNLHNAGFEVQAYDIMEPARTAARDAGLTVKDTALETLAGFSTGDGSAEIVLTMFPSGLHLLQAYQGPDGLLAHAPVGALMLDCSTIEVGQAREAAELAHASAHPAVDAPVSGGVVGADAATLTFMVGGGEDEVGVVMPLLEAMGKRIVHCGANGAGQAAKICNNMLLGISMIGACEAFVLGERLGLSGQALFDVISTASGQCWAVTTNSPVPGTVPTSPANHGFAPGFATALMAKDLGLAKSAIEQVGLHAPLGLLAETLYRDFRDGGGAARDFSAIIEEIKEA